MQTYLKSRPVIVQLMLFLGLAFGIYIVLSFIGAPILERMTGISVIAYASDNLGAGDRSATITFIRGMLLIQFLGLFLIPSLLFAYFSDPQPRDYLRLRPPYTSGYWGLGILLLLVCYPLVEYTGLLNRQVNFGGAQQWVQGMEEDALRLIRLMLDKQSGTDLAANLVFIALFAGVGEELFFRGILQRMFIRGTRSAWAGIIITAILFSAFHFQFLGFLPRLLLGILLGALYWYSGSIYTAILAHFLYDAAQIFLVYTQPRLLAENEATLINPEMLLPAAAFSLLITGLLVYLLIRRSPARYEAVYRNDFDSGENEAV